MVNGYCQKTLESWVRDNAHYYSKSSSQSFLLVCIGYPWSTSPMGWHRTHDGCLYMQCIVLQGRNPEFGEEVTAFLVHRSKPAFCPAKDIACCKQNSACEEWSGLLLVHPIRMCREAQDPRRIASPNNGFLCAINLNVNGKPFLTSQVLISNSKLNKASNSLYCRVQIRDL